MSRRALGQRAYEPVPEGEAFEPYIPAAESPLEFTLKAIVPGIVFGLTGVLLLALGVARLLTPDPQTGDSPAASRRSQLGAPIAGIALGALSLVGAGLSLLAAL